MTSEPREPTFAPSHCFLLAIVVIGIYFPSIYFQFCLDDFTHLVGNIGLSSFDGIWQALHQPMFPGNLYRPLVTLTLGLTKLAFGENPLPYHLTNILMHAGLTVLIYIYLTRLIAKDTAALITLVFAIHPLHTEVVANISNRTELLSNFFGIAALLVCTKGDILDTVRAFRTFVFSFFLFLCALASKESGLIYILLIVITLWYQRRLQAANLIKSIAGPLAAVIIYGIARFVVLGGLGLGMQVIEPLDNPLIQTPQPSRLLNALGLLGKYAQLVVYPAPLSADYSYRQLTGPSWQTLFSSATELSFLATFLFILYVALRGIHRRGRFSLFALWFLASFLITSNILFPIGTIFGERLCYLPSLGIIAIGILGLSKLSSNLIKATAFIAIIFLEVLATASHLRVWYNNDTLFSYQIEVSPNSAKTHSNYALTLRNRGDFPGATKHLEQALAIYPSFVEAQYGLATVALAQGKQEEAIGLLDRAIEIDGTYQPAKIERERLRQLLKR
jgi:tetratricopeptide (TPR) repeat protein